MVKMPEVPEGIQTTPGVRRRPQPEEGPLTIVHEDDTVLVVNKPAGVVVHPTYKNSSGTLLNAVLWHVRDCAARPGILTRLDKDTSGLVVIALTPEVHATMQKDAAAGRTHKHYLALVCGLPEPPRGTIVLPLARDPADRRRVVVTPDGARCETRYEVVSTCDAHSMVRCQLVTGRTHQIRVHLAARGWPILGDQVYGQSDPHIARQALHAWRVMFPHPVTREPMEFEQPLPEDMRGLADPGESHSTPF